MVLPIFRKSPFEIYAPTKLSFSSMYQHGTETKGVPGDSVKSLAKEALRKAGWSNDRISAAITYDKKLPLEQVKEVTAVLHRAGVYGFENDPAESFKRLINKERVKNESIARRIKETILERATEDLGHYGKTSLSGKDISPNASDEPVFGHIKRRAIDNASRSLSVKAKEKKGASYYLGNTGGADSLLTTPAKDGTGIAAASGSFKPKF